MEKENKINKKVIIIAIVAILLICTIVICVMLIPKNNDINSNKNISIEEEMINNVEKGQERHETIQKDNLENAELINGEKHNTSEKLLEERTWNNLLIKDIKLYSENGNTVFQANVVNQTDKDIEDQVIEVMFKNSDGTIYGRTKGYIGDIQPGNTKQLYITTSNDFVNAYDFEIKTSE